MAEEIGITRQMFWRVKKRLEDDGHIWGYTAAVDETTVGWTMGVILFKTRPVKPEVVERALGLIRSGEMDRTGVRQLDTVFTNGLYDVVVTFMAPDPLTARRYYEFLRTHFEDNHLDKPEMLEVIFPIYREGKPNPGMGRFRDLVPGEMGAPPAAVTKGTWPRPLHNYDEKVLNALIRDPTESTASMAQGLGITRQRLWREKRSMEERGLIWGYTACTDDRSLGGVAGVLLFQSRSMTSEIADRAIGRVSRLDFRASKVRIQNVLYVNGRYESIVMFSAPDIVTARGYYESLRTYFGDHLMEKPVMLEVLFTLYRGGKLNPRPEGLRGLLP